MQKIFATLAVILFLALLVTSNNLETGNISNLQGGLLMAVEIVGLILFQFLAVRKWRG